MSYATDIFLTYDDTNKMPDVTEMILQINPVDSPLWSGLPKTRAKAVNHEWMEESLTTYQDNAAEEGGTFGDPQHDQPTRPSNTCQIFEKVYEVSSTERWIDNYGFEDQYIKQEMDAMKKLNTDIERALVRGSRSTGNASTARRLGGFLNFISANTTDYSGASGTKLTESLFNQTLQTCWTYGGRPDEIYVGAALKRVISQYTAGSTKQMETKDRRVVNTVSVYESDFGVQKLFLHRDMPSTANTDAAVLFIDRMKNAVAIGEAPHILGKEEVSQTKHATKGVIRGELTLKVGAQKHQASIVGLDVAFPA